MKENQDGKTIYHYHESTKHHPYQLAKSLGYMDWANEPAPFRFYENAERIALPLIQKEQEISYQSLYFGRNGKIAPITLETIASFLELSMGLSAWKKYERSEWVLRMNPSSGNLHPTESYLILPSFEGMSSFVAHYNPYLHALEILALLDDTAASSLSKTGGFGVILTSIYWREAWKYGERAFRYCNHDVGHALCALRFSANLLGWKIRLQPDIGNQSLDTFLGFHDRAWVECEEEHSDCLCWVHPYTARSDMAEKFFAHCRIPKYYHTPNRLSDEHVNWEIIEEVSQATRAPAHKPQIDSCNNAELVYPTDSPLSAQDIIRCRRSAQAYDSAKSEIDLYTFLAILEKTVPAAHAPFDCFPYEPQTHLVLFVHKVKGIGPGLYLFVRNPEQREELQRLLSENFLWQQVKEASLLYLLQQGDLREVAQVVSCQQAIAGDSAFSLGMLTRFQPILEIVPWMYPRLFWETGIIGQVLYLEAEAHGLRGTGIGCFFDDLVHDLLGLKENIYQDLYHFTIGFPLEDQRLQTIPPYYHLDKRG